VSDALEAVGWVLVALLAVYLVHVVLGGLGR